MVKMTLPILAAALLAACCSSEPECTKGSEFEPPLCPSKYTRVSTISIGKNAATHSAEKSPETDCRGFVLSKEDIKRFFELAKVTNENDAHHTLDWTPCYASGEVEFQNGQKASWEINGFRQGRITFTDGKQVILYCPDCTFQPFFP